MATTQTIDATIFASTHPDIAKRISVSGVLISSVIDWYFSFCFNIRIGRQVFYSQYGFDGFGNRFIPYRNFPSFLEIKGGCLFTNKKCG